MIYLSCLEIDTDQSAARRLLGNAYQIHQRLLTAWPGATPGRVLYRVESDRQPPRILVQSAEPADWERCFAGLGVLCGQPRQKGVELEPRPGQVFRFFVRANPTIRRLQFDPEETQGPITGQRVGLLREEEQLAWLHRKAENGGFAILAVEARDRGEQISYKASARTRFVHQCVDFEGRLRVLDSERLSEAVVGGIGPAKAFGFGLLSLAPVG